MKGCCHGYQVTKEDKIAKECFWYFHIFCFSENRIRISYIGRKICHFIQFVNVYPYLDIQL